MIRKANINDIKQLAELFDAYRVFYKKQPDLSMAEKFLTDRITNRDSEIFVLDKDGTLAGFVQLYPLFSSTRMRKLWLLNDLFVKEDERGNGFSKDLINAAKDLCKKTEACGLILETAKTNLIGNSLYPQTGFVLDEEHNYYSWDC